MWIAVAQPTDLPNDTVTLMLVGLGLFIVGAILVVVAVGLARWRGNRRVGLMGWVAALCVLMLMGTVGMGLYQQYAFSTERELRLRTRSYDPSIESQAPAWPWAPTIVLAVGYGMILAACTLGGGRGEKERRAAGPP